MAKSSPIDTGTLDRIICSSIYKSTPQGRYSTFEESYQHYSALVGSGKANLIQAIQEHSKMPEHPYSNASQNHSFINNVKNHLHKRLPAQDIAQEIITKERAEIAYRRKQLDSNFEFFWSKKVVYALIASEVAGFATNTFHLMIIPAGYIAAIGFARGMTYFQDRHERAELRMLSMYVDLPVQRWSERIEHLKPEISRIIYSPANQEKLKQEMW